MNDEERAKILAMIGRDPVIQEQHERERHVLVSREVAGSRSMNERVIDPIAVRMFCERCNEYKKWSLEHVWAANGALPCPTCRRTIDVLGQDLQDLARLTRAIRINDYDMYMDAIITLNLRSTPRLGVSD